MNRLRSPPRSIESTVISTIARPAGRALERALAQAARENRQAEMDRLAQADDRVIGQAAALHEAGVRVRTLLQFYETPEAFTARMFVAAVIRRRATRRDVSRARSIIEVAHRWRATRGQSLDGRVAFHLGKKLLKEQIDHDLSLQVVGRKLNYDRDEAMTQLLALLKPAPRVSVHADLLCYVHERAAMVRMVAPSFADGAQLTREELQALGRRRARRIEESGVTFLGRASMQAQTFDSTESDYDPKYANDAERAR